MEMPPRDALVPLLKLAGTAVVAAAAYRYGSKHVVAAAHRQHRDSRQSSHSSADASKRKHTTSGAQEPVVAVDPPASAPLPLPTELVVPHIPRSSLVMAMLLRDGYLVRKLRLSRRKVCECVTNHPVSVVCWAQLLAALGAFVMGLAVLLAVAIVAFDDHVTSVEELRMFAPLVCIGMGLVSGMRGCV